jgi:hypothetical protein
MEIIRLWIRPQVPLSELAIRLEMISIATISQRKIEPSSPTVAKLDILVPPAALSADMIQPLARTRYFEWAAQKGITMAITMTGRLKDMAKIEVLQACLGVHYLRIRNALEILQRPRLDVAHYQFIVVLENSLVYVILKDTTEQTDTPEHFGVQTERKEVLTPEQLQQTLGRLEQITTLDKIQGVHYPQIRVAANVFLERLPAADLAKYKISVVRDGESLVVIFTDKDRDPMTRGHNPKCPEFEVELNQVDLTVRRANFLR